MKFGTEIDYSLDYNLGYLFYRKNLQFPWDNIYFDGDEIVGKR